MKIAVLGCGPAGLLSAHALKQMGYSVSILSHKKKSPMGGAQYLHSPIPGLCPQEPEAVVKFVVRGDASTYCQKVGYAPQWESKVSFHSFKDGQEVPAWNLTAVYDKLWKHYEPVITDVPPISGWDVMMNLGRIDVIFSSIPLPSLCVHPGGHHFGYQEVGIVPRAVEPLEEGTIIYDGTNDRRWYREANLWGWQSTEYGGNLKQVVLPGVVRVRKPVNHNCDCWKKTPRFIPVGRFGRWEKSQLTHHAYLQTVASMYEFVS